MGVVFRSGILVLILVFSSLVSASLPSQPIELWGRSDRGVSYNGIQADMHRFYYSLTIPSDNPITYLDDPDCLFHHACQTCSTDPDSPDYCIEGVAIGDEIELISQGVSYFTTISSHVVQYDIHVGCNDRDGDGFGSPQSEFCPHQELDCDDTNRDINPHASESCNGYDDNCNGLIDTDDPQYSSSCGTGTCTGTRSCVDGVEGACTTFGQDGGTCTLCGFDGNQLYDIEDSDCDEFDQTQIISCEANPDGNPWTWDFQPAFNSRCTNIFDEETQQYSCTKGREITHECNLACGAECTKDSDCADGFSCSAGCACVSNNPGIPGDFDNNGAVDFTDFLQFAAAFGGTDPKYDIDGLGTVDFADFLIFAQNFGRTASKPATAWMMSLTENDIISCGNNPSLCKQTSLQIDSPLVVQEFIARVGDKEDILAPGDTFDEAQPGDIVEFEITLSNENSLESGLVYEGTEIEFSILNIDDDGNDDLDDEVRIGDLNPQQSKINSETFRIPHDVKSGTYSLQLNIKADINGEPADYTLYYQLEIEKDKYGLAIINPYIDSQIVATDQGTTLRFSIVNTGEEDLTDISLRVSNNGIGLSVQETSISIPANKGSESVLAKTYELPAISNQGEFVIGVQADDGLASGDNHILFIVNNEISQDIEQQESFINISELDLSYNDEMLGIEEGRKYFIEKLDPAEIEFKFQVDNLFPENTRYDLEDVETSVEIRDYQNKIVAFSEDEIEDIQSGEWGQGAHRVSVEDLEDGLYTIFVNATGEQLDYLHKDSFQFRLYLGEILVGDYDRNYCVDYQDFLSFANAFGSRSAYHDLNGDEMVQFEDFIIFADIYGTGNCPMSANKVAVSQMEAELGINQLENSNDIAEPVVAEPIATPVMETPVNNPPACVPNLQCSWSKTDYRGHGCGVETCDDGCGNRYNRNELACPTQCEKRAYYEDSDYDGYGNPNKVRYECSAPARHVLNSADCNDKSDNINPGAPEQCNGYDDNCNGQIDENVGNIYYQDRDGDGKGDKTSSQRSCIKPTGYVSDNSDCNDRDPSKSAISCGVCGGCGAGFECESNQCVQKALIRPTVPIKGDFVKDGCVDEKDQIDFTNHFGQHVSGSNSIYDLNRDGIIDFYDFLEFAESFGKGC